MKLSKQCQHGVQTLPCKLLKLGAGDGTRTREWAMARTAVWPQTGMKRNRYRDIVGAPQTTKVDDVWQYEAAREYGPGRVGTDE